MKICRARMLRIAGILLIFAAPLSNSVAQIFGSDAHAPKDRQKPNAPPASPGVLARNLIGNRVESDRGDELGTVSDLLIDPRSGRLDYVIVASGGFLKFGRKLRPVPASLLNTATAKRGVIEADIDSEHWKTAATFAHASLAELGGDDAGRKIYGYYHQKWPGSTIRAEGKATRRASRHSGNPEQLEFSSYLIGRQLLDRDGRKVARIADVLLDFRNPQVSFAVIRSEGSPGAGVAAVRQQFAVPINNLNEAAENEMLTMPATAIQIQQAPPLNAATWTTASLTNAPPIYRFQSDDLSSSEPASTLTRE